MEREAAEAAYSALHGKDAAYHDGTFTDWAKTRSASHPYAAQSGMSIGVADRNLAPWDAFTTQVNASPVESVAQESPGEKDDAHPDGSERQGPGQD